MTTVHDFVEEWIEIRAKLQRQLKAPDAGQAGGVATMQSAAATETSARIKKCIAELNALLKEHAAADKT